ncbi:MAG: hypothetical protein ACR2K2_11445 [Mycobacteriales bacterium]
MSVVLLGALSIGAAAPGVARKREEARLDKAASALAGTPVQVRCQTLGGAFVDAVAELGYVRYGADGKPEHRTLIKHEQCADLAAYLRSSKHRPSRSQIVAVHVLTHESMHMAGLTDEVTAECAAVQRDSRTARLLGANPADARLLAQAYWRTLYPRMPDDYRSPDCAPGRSLDERLADAPWLPAAG